MRSEVLNVANIMSTVFLNMTHHSLAERHKCFQETWCLHLLPWRWRQQYRLNESTYPTNYVVLQLRELYS